MRVSWRASTRICRMVARASSGRLLSRRSSWACKSIAVDRVLQIVHDERHQALFLQLKAHHVVALLLEQHVVIARARRASAAA